MYEWITERDVNLKFAKMLEINGTKLKQHIWDPLVRIQIKHFIGGSQGGLGTHAPSRSNFFDFDVVLSKNIILPNNNFLPQTQGLTPPCLGNPGSATAFTRDTLYIGLAYNEFGYN